MPLPPQKATELLFLLLYARNVSASEEEETLCLIQETLKVSRRFVLEARERVLLIEKRKRFFEFVLNEMSSEYTPDRMPWVERTLLELSLYPLFFEKNQPFAQILSEGIRLAKKFGGPQSFRFIHALLDRIEKEKEKFSISNEK